MTFCLFVCLFVWALCPWFGIFLPSSLSFCVVHELSEMKVCVKSAAHSGKKSLVALETDTKWAWAGAAVCTEPKYLGWPLGQGFRSIPRERIPRRTSWSLRLHRLWNEQCELPMLLADSSHSWSGPWSMHPGQSLPLLTLHSSVLGVVQGLWARRGKKERAARH